MLQFFAGICYELVRVFAPLVGLGGIVSVFFGLTRNDYPMFEQGLSLGLIAVVLAVLARGLRRFEL